MTLGSSSDVMDINMSMQWGEAVIYVKELTDGMEWNRFLPDPHDSTTYDYTSVGQSVDSIHVPGPHESATTFIIGVFPVSNSTCRYTVVGSFSSTAIVLQEGVPQRHFVNQGHNEYFVFNMDRQDADVSVTVTAITGDPDILISYTNPTPGCTVQPGSTTRVCTNYTWMSNDFQSDTITITHSNPCAPSSSSVTVSPDCVNSEAFGMGRFYVATYGFSGSSTYTITAKYTGGRTKLITGVPQTGHTYSSHVCTHRNSVGVCGGSDEHEVQAGYFEFERGGEALDQSETHVSFAITPVCTADEDPGCKSGGKLTAYVNVCVKDDTDPNKCTVNSAYPTAGNSDMMEELEPEARTVVFIANDRAHSTSTSCNPVNDGASCMYYVAIEGIDDIYDEASFSISAVTPDNLVVIPCRPTPAPDGVITWGQDNVRSEVQGYEVCGTDLLPHGWLDVTLEVCSGDLTLRICDGDNSCDGIVPTADDFSVSSNFEKTCYEKHGSESYCEDNVDGALPNVRVNYAARDTYFMSVEGTGSYNLWLGR